MELMYRGPPDTHSVRLVQTEPGPLEKGLQIGQNDNLPQPDPLKINSLAEASGVDIAGVASQSVSR